MKAKTLIPSIVFLMGIALSAQEKYDDLVKVGDELTIGTPSGANYRFIDIPKKNFIIKKGGIVNMGSLPNSKVLVTGIKRNKSNETIVTFKRSNGSKFFNAYRILRANLNRAIAEGELKIGKSPTSGKIAK